MATEVQNPPPANLAENPETETSITTITSCLPQEPQAGIDFWTTHTKPVLSSLLKSIGTYTAAQQATHLSFLSTHIIPTMGPRPSPQKAKSLLTPNGSPLETSINHSDAGASTLRFCYEPVFPPYSALDPIPGIAAAVGADLGWFEKFAKAYYPSGEDEVKLTEVMPKNTIRIPKVFLAFDLKGSRQSMKAYFYPVIKNMTSGLNSDNAVFELVRSLGVEGFDEQLGVIEGYEKRLGGEEGPLTVVVGIDCIKVEEGARIKIYIEPRSNSFAAAKQHLTLGGLLKDKTTLEGVEILREMWNLMINEPEEKEIDEGWEKPVKETFPKSSGACFSWELRPGKTVPDVKVYVSLRQFYETDRGIVGAMEKVFAKRGWAWGVEGKYGEVIGDAFGSDVLDDGIETPTVHSFISFNFSEKKGAYMTTYAAPFVRFP